MIIRAYLGTTLKNGLLCMCWLTDSEKGKIALLTVVDFRATECLLTLATDFLLSIVPPESQVIINSCDKKILSTSKSQQILAKHYCQHKYITESCKLSYENVLKLTKDTVTILNL